MGDQWGRWSRRLVRVYAKWRISSFLLASSVESSMWRTQVTSPYVKYRTPCRYTISVSRQFSVPYHRNFKGQSDKFTLPYRFLLDACLETACSPILSADHLPAESHIAFMPRITARLRPTISLSYAPARKEQLEVRYFMRSSPEQAIVEDCRASTCSLKSGRCHRITQPRKYRRSLRDCTITGSTLLAPISDGLHFGQSWGTGRSVSLCYARRVLLLYQLGSVQGFIVQNCEEIELS